MSWCDDLLLQRPDGPDIPLLWTVKTKGHALPAESLRQLRDWSPPGALRDGRDSRPARSHGTVQLTVLGTHGRDLGNS